MRKLLFTLTALFALLVCSGAAFAQDYSHDSVKVTGAFQNLNVANNNLPGINASVDYKIGGYGRWRLGFVVDGAYQRDVNRILDRYQLLGGAQLAYSIGKDRLSVFGRGLYGLTRFDQVSFDGDFNRMTVGVGGGADVHFGAFFVRPVQFDLQWIDRRPVRYTRFATGGGFRF